LSAIRHRGPDDASIWVDPPFGLAHARLSIIDLSDAARQPMLDSTGRFALVFNGEIYNYRELADKFFAEDTSLRRTSDTAVLLALYRRFGIDCVQHLDGMFAFAVIDREAKSIFLARDRFGEKPLYWLQTDGYLAYASEIAALRQLLPEYDWSVDAEALLLYHCMGSVPAPYTIYRGVRSLNAGCWIAFDTNRGAVERAYWRLNDATPLTLDRHSALAGVRTRLVHAVRSRLVSDVPVGIFLSGGLDSSSILSLARSLDADVPDSLCIDFPDPRFSEYALASETARTFGSRLHRFLVTPKEFVAHMDAFFTAADQPTTDGFNTYFAALHARQTGIKVWLSGVGGDELFGGYPSFVRMGRRTMLSRVLQSLVPRSVIALAEQQLPYQYRLARILELGRPGMPCRRAYQSLRNTIPPAMAHELLSQTMRIKGSSVTQLLDRVYPGGDSCHDDYQRASLFESSVYMRYQLLRDIDNFSMAHSIEVRAPFLDHTLFEYVHQLPSAYKKADKRLKPLLLDALPRPLPDSVVYQPKRGFTFPLETWLRNELSQSWETIVLKRENAAFWDLHALASLWRVYLAGYLHWSVPWQFYAFAQWWRTRHAQH